MNFREMGMTGKFFFIPFVEMGIFPSDERNRIKKYIYTSKLLPLFPATKVRRFELGFLEHLQKGERDMKTEVEVRGASIKDPQPHFSFFSFFFVPNLLFPHTKNKEEERSRFPTPPVTLRIFFLSFRGRGRGLGIPF